MSINMHVWVILYTGLYGTCQLFLLHITVEGAVGPVGEGGHTGLHTAAGAFSVRPPPPLVLHH